MKIEKELRSRLLGFLMGSAVAALSFNACVWAYFYVTQGTIRAVIMPGLAHPVDHMLDVYALWVLIFAAIVLIEVFDGLLAMFLGMLCSIGVILTVRWGWEVALKMVAVSAIIILVRSLWRIENGAHESSSR